MKTRFRLTYLLGVGICSIALYYNQISFCHCLRVFLAVSLFWNYLLTRPKESKTILVILAISALFSSLPFILVKPFDLQPNNLFHLYFLIVHLCYICIFKIEKANAVAYEQKSNIIILIAIGFVFLMAINEHVDDFAFFSLLLSIFVEIVMFWLAFSRHVNAKSYQLGTCAMILFVLTNFSISTGFFTESELTRISTNFFYVIGQFLLFESFLAKHADTSKVELSNM